MKWLNTLVMVVLLAGCAEQEFAGGFASGAIAMKALAESSQTKFIEAVNELNAETTKLNAEISTVENIDIKDFIKPETFEAIENLKGREKDPIFWLTLASLLGGGFFGGKVHEKRKAAGGVK